MSPLPSGILLGIGAYRVLGRSPGSSNGRVWPIQPRERNRRKRCRRYGKIRMTTPIQASALRIGMFVHLNVGWMSHPFPLSSFKLTTQEQIEPIRSLGLARLTWSPERSDIEQPAVETSAAGVEDSQPAEEAPK